MRKWNKNLSALVQPLVVGVLSCAAYMVLGNSSGVLEQRALSDTSYAIVQALQHHTAQDRDGLWLSLSELSSRMPNYASTHEKLGDIYTHLKAYPLALHEYALADKADVAVAKTDKTNKTAVTTAHIATKQARAVKYLNVRFLQEQGNVTADMYTLLQQLVTQETESHPLPEVHNLLAIHAFQQQDYAKAMTEWRTVFQNLEEPELGEHLKQLIAQAQFQLNIKEHTENEEHKESLRNLETRSVVKVTIQG
ncbi:MAG: hypothetical protein V4490_02610, partial [Pseudomonadota bacterium]